MGADYSKNLFKQLTEQSERIEELEKENRWLRKENTELRSENKRLREKIEVLETTMDEAIILDVRTAEEYAEGHIQDAVLLPYDEIGGQAAELLPDKDATILVYCRTGRRSEIAAKELISLGYTAVYDFGGITTDWNGDIVK